MDARASRALTPYRGIRLMALVGQVITGTGSVHSGLVAGGPRLRLEVASGTVPSSGCIRVSRSPGHGSRKAAWLPPWTRAHRPRHLSRCC
jgi:hypothetical protein